MPKPQPGLRRFNTTEADRYATIEASFEERTLRLVCENGPYRNAVVLANDLWPSNPNSAMPYPFVEQALVELNELGYIIYVEGEDLVPVKIRATREGYDAAGMPPPIQIIGPKRWSFPHPVVPQPNHYDYTNFWYHSKYAVGGEIEREPIVLHMLRFPDHLHLVEEAEMTNAPSDRHIRAEIHRGQGDGLSTITHDKIVDMLAAKQPNRVIMSSLGVSSHTVTKVAREIGWKRKVGRPPRAKAAAAPVPTEAIVIDTETAARVAAHARSAPITLLPGGPTEYVPAKQPVTAGEYPLIDAVLHRREKIENAARALDEAGLVDLGLAALAQLDNMTDLEKEIIRYFGEK